LRHISSAALSDWLPYERGAVLTGTRADFAKLRAAWRIVERRSRDGGLFDFTGLVRSLDVGDDVLDDELSPALYGERLIELALEHLGGVAGRDDVFVANRTTAALVAAMQVLVRPGSRVVGVSPSYTHPAALRAVRFAGGAFEDGGDPAGADLVLLTRLAVTYELLPTEELVRGFGAPVFLDDAGGARVGPAVFGQPRALELPVEAAVTGLDKYGTTGPRLGLLAGRAALVAEIRARAIELGLEARPMLYAAVVRSLERYRPERVRELVVATAAVGEALAERLGSLVTRTPVAVRLEGEATLDEALRRAGLGGTSVVPLEATAALAMVLLRDHGVLTVHFAAVPPGTAALLLKFVPPETLERFGGPVAFARAVDESLDEVARLLRAPGELAELLRPE
jgi:L-seryl-tRNA(Ser) seleniumtransferase